MKSVGRQITNKLQHSYHVKFTPLRPTRSNGLIASRRLCELSRRQSARVRGNLEQSEQLVLYRIGLADWLLLATQIGSRLVCGRLRSRRGDRVYMPICLKIF